MIRQTMCAAAAALILASCSVSDKPAYDGSKLWFQCADTPTGVPVLCSDTTPMLRIAKRELAAFGGSAAVSLQLVADSTLRADGFAISRNADTITICAQREQGLLYGAFHLMRLQSVGKAVESPIVEVPWFDVRVLNHWDNLDGTIERGYAGQSLWQWDSLPAISPRYAEYARANASVGINAVVLNNVNASPEILSAEYLDKVKVLADIFRNYGIKVYLSVNFSSPMALGGLPDADPLRPEVREWWRMKVNEIYSLIPDFGGFLVKANSEGLPGPLDYGRSHADGANMLAAALKEHGGLVMWRAFVYSPADADRAKQAYLEFEPHDGEFADNVIIQIKNGPVDFQPREPFSPLFGAMPNTRVMAEFQITQEYTGFSNHLCFLPDMWLETLCADTHSYGDSSTIARITRGDFNGKGPSAIAGVANIGNNANWCGHPFAQANWYAFGRMAWNPRLTVGELAQEWIRQTMPGLNAARETVVRNIMLQSREAVVDYMMPLGLHHLFAWTHHYGPEPWCAVEGARPDWMPSYYHRADTVGVGFDRSPSGSAGNAQYSEPLASEYGNIATCPDELLLWFHHAPWDHTMHSGRTLWDELCFRYKRGVDVARGFAADWASLRGSIDDALWQQVADKLMVQYHDAIWWHDACLLYFQTFSKQPIPQEVTCDLDEMKAFRIDITNYEAPQCGFLNPKE